MAFWYQTGTPTFKARAPSAKERKLPNLDRVIVLAKDFVDHQHHGPGQAKPQTLGELYPQPQMLYHPVRIEDAWVELPVEVKAKEPLRLLISATRTPDGGTYQAYLDEVPVGKPIDLYNDKVDDFEYHLLDFWPEPGKYTFTLECIGKNPKSTGIDLGLESVRLRERRPRVAQYGYDKDKDWRKTRRCLKTISYASARRYLPAPRPAAENRFPRNARNGAGAAERPCCRLVSEDIALPDSAAMPSGRFSTVSVCRVMRWIA